MPTIEYTDSLNAPKESVVINADTKNPTAFYNTIRKRMQILLETNSPNIYEDKFKWDATDGSFFGMWKGIRKEDRWTELQINIKSWGVLRFDEERTGKIRVEIKGLLKTKVEYWHSIQKALWWFYCFIFYNEQRRKYFERGKFYYMKSIEDYVKDQLGILPKKFS